jgi:hypothetical protein
MIWLAIAVCLGGVAVALAVVLAGAWSEWH